MSRFSPVELFFNNKDDVTNRKLYGVEISSTIQERDKKNAKYYVGDYWANPLKQFHVNYIKIDVIHGKIQLVQSIFDVIIEFS